MNKNELCHAVAQWAVRLLMIGIVIAAVAILALFGKDLSIDGIMAAIPSDAWLTAAFLLILFCVKGILIFIPIDVILVVGGFLFPLPHSVVLNIIGVWLCMTVPYLFTRVLGGKFIQKILSKYSKLEHINRLQQTNAVFLNYMLRIAGIAPFDIVSMYMGSVKVPYGKYILGSMLGISASILAATVIGRSITEPTSPEFIISCIFRVLIAVISFFAYKHYLKKHEVRSEEGT